MLTFSQEPLIINRSDNQVQCVLYEKKTREQASCGNSKLIYPCSNSIFIRKRRLYDKKARIYDIFSYYREYIEVFKKSGRHLYTSLRGNQCSLSKGMKQNNRI